MKVSGPRLSILPDGHENSDEATERFRRVRVPALKMLHPCVGEEVSVMCVGVRVLCVWAFLGTKKHRAGERVSSIQGKFKMQTHSISGVAMDIAAFKVSHSVDTDATALRAARQSEVKLHRGDG